MRALDTLPPPWMASRWRVRGGHTRWPLHAVRTNRKRLAMIEAWMRSYGPEELLGDNGAPVVARPDLTGWTWPREP